MSYDSRQGGRAQGANHARQDQLRATRGRMQPDASRMIGLPQRPDHFVPQNSSRRANQMPLRAVPATEGEMVDRESPEPQWPLPNNMTDVPHFSPIVPPRSPKRLQPPQQFSRPFSDDYPVQHLFSPGHPSQPSPAYLHPSPGNGVSHANQNLLSPDSYQSSRPLTTSSAASEASSLGDIPDFPVADMPSAQQARRAPGLGPPPSARKGPTSYYPQIPYVSPIVEEADSRSGTSISRHGSYASSNVFPSNSDGFYPEDDMFSEDERDTVTSDRGTVTPDHDDRSGLVKPSPSLMRQASLGRRSKPSLMTIKSTDNFTGGAKTKPAEIGAGTGMIGASGAMLAARDGSPAGLARSPLSDGRGLAPSASPFSDPANVVGGKEGKSTNLVGTAASPHPLSQEMRPTVLAGRAGLRRPLNIDMEAVRDAEARGSITSLPDLIRRATKLAANLDRGRTASRLGLDFWESGMSEKRDGRQSGLSDMLAAFPPPGQDTPLRSGTPNAGRWPLVGGSRTEGTDSQQSNDKSKKRRRCCGMPLWVFVVLLIALLVSIAAAITLPIVFVVLPNQNKNNNSAAQENGSTGGSGDNNGGNSGTTASMVLPGPTSKPSSNQCGGILTCQNGGVAIPNADRSCNCICINGFTGRTCTDNDANGCTATTIANTANNATVGNGIPRLVASAGKDYNVPLDATRILSLFSNMSLSCAAENALVTFNGLASRSIPQRFSMSAFHAARSFPILHHPHSPQAFKQPAKRQTAGQSGPNKLITQPVSSNVIALDFARIGVLFALQESGDLDTASKAQDAIQKFLTSNHGGSSTGTRVEVGPFDMDLVDFTIVFKNGTTIRAPQRGPSF